MNRIRIILRLFKNTLWSGVGCLTDCWFAGTAIRLAAMPGNSVEQNRFVSAYNPPEGCFFTQRPRQDDCALNTANRLLREWLSLRRRNVRGFETMSQRRYPAGKVVPDPAGKGVPGGTQTDPTDETHSPTRSEIGRYLRDHGPDCRCRIAGMLKRSKDRRAEPAVYVG